MDYTVLLDVGSVTDDYRTKIAPEHCTGGYVTVVTDFDVTDQNRLRVYTTIHPYLRAFTLELIHRHNHTPP
jgi:hypothetical protein